MSAARAVETPWEHGRRHLRRSRAKARLLSFELKDSRGAILGSKLIKAAETQSRCSTASSLPSRISVLVYPTSKAETRAIATALELYANDHGSYHPDVSRDIPPGLEKYLGSSGDWPKAPWPGSIYDWDAWAPSDLAYDPKQQVYQLSIRFCPFNQPLSCAFPNQPWAQNFDYYSAVYYCVSGPCRSHSSQPINYPGYCLNC